MDERTIVSRSGAYGFRQLPVSAIADDSGDSCAGVPVLALTATAHAAVVGDIPGTIACTGEECVPDKLSDPSEPCLHRAPCGRQAGHAGLHAPEKVPGTFIVCTRSRRADKEARSLHCSRPEYLPISFMPD
ncbi:MAG: hypothetical protein ACLR6J_14805 [Parabacteroides merdae]